MPAEVPSVPDPAVPPFVQRWRPIMLVVVVPLAAVVAAIALLWMADEAHYRGCLDQAALKYPAVPVSAFVDTSKANVGPIKVSYAQQRISAASSCHHL